jgi:hypothetical protein
LRDRIVYFVDDFAWPARLQVSRVGGHRRGNLWTRRTISSGELVDRY